MKTIYLALLCLVHVVTGMHAHRENEQRNNNYIKSETLPALPAPNPLTVRVVLPTPSPNTETRTLPTPSPPTNKVEIPTPSPISGVSKSTTLRPTTVRIPSKTVQTTVRQTTVRLSYKTVHTSMDRNHKLPSTTVRPPIVRISNKTVHTSNDGNHLSHAFGNGAEAASNAHYMKYYSAIIFGLMILQFEDRYGVK